MPFENTNLRQEGLQEESVPKGKKNGGNGKKK